MRSAWGKSFLAAQTWVQLVAAILLSITAVVLSATTFLAAAGVLPWLELPLSFGGNQIPNGGAIAQLAVTLLLLAICVFLPSSIRVMRLEAAHREFGLRMDDVARAYWAAHAADREGVFNLAREYDAVRDRLLFLQSHPDLGKLDSDVLEIAAQMSHESRELADIYSDENVARARETLNRRRLQAEEMNQRIAEANRAMAEIRRMSDEVGLEEDILHSRINRLREDVADIVHLLEPPQPSDNKPAARRAKIGVVQGK